MKSTSRMLIPLVLFAATVLLAGCSGAPDRPSKAKWATVQIRRDLLGAGGNLPISPTTGSFNGADVCVTGKLLKVNEEWVVLERDKQEIWIPRENVLLIQID